MFELTDERVADHLRKQAPGSRRPTEEISDAYDRADALEMAKAAGAHVSGARIAESEQLAEALHEFPVKRSPFTLPGGESPGSSRRRPAPRNSKPRRPT